MILHIFFRVHVNEYWHFREILLSNRHFLGFKPKYSDTSYQGVTKQYYTLFSGFILKNSDTFTEILPYNSTHFFHSSFQIILTLSERYDQTLHTFCKSSCKTIQTFSGSYYQTMLHTFLIIHITQYIFS